MRNPKSEKAKRTLKDMKERRTNDSISLREEIKAKLTWAKEEKKKGVIVIEKQLAQIKENTITINKLDGVIMVLIELLEHKILKSEKEKKVE